MISEEYQNRIQKAIKALNIAYVQADNTEDREMIQDELNSILSTQRDINSELITMNKQLSYVENNITNKLQ